MNRLQYAFGDSVNRNGFTSIAICIDGYHVGYIFQRRLTNPVYKGRPVVFRPNYGCDIAIKKAAYYGLWDSWYGPRIVAFSIEEAKTKIRRIIRRG